MADLTALIERLEKADGPDRELDARIHAAVFPKAQFMTYGGGTRTKAPATYDDIGNFDFDKWAEVGDTVDWDALAHMFGASERYSASIDAAVALATRLLPNWTATADLLNPPPLFDKFGVRLFNANGNWSGVKAEAATPYLAICLATLRALEAKNG